MAEYLLGLSTLPAVALLGWLVLLAGVPTNTTRLRCGCGVDWGNPKGRRWTWWWERLVLFAHDRGRRHRGWVAETVAAGSEKRGDPSPSASNEL